MKRNHWLDFLKLTFIIIIAFCHTTWWTNMKYGFLPVEFFFIVSGYFVYASYLKNKSFGKFVTDKIWYLFPTYLVILFIYAIYSLIFPKFNSSCLYEHWGLSLAREALLLQSVGLTKLFNVSLINTMQDAWYVSVYFYGAIMLYGLLTYAPKRFVNYTLSTIVIGVYGFYFLAWDGTMEIWTYKSIFYMPLWRGLANMSVGILLGMVLKKEYVNKWSNTHKVCFNTLGVIAISGAFFSFFSPIDIEWLGIICFVYILANAVSSNGIGSYFNKTKYAKYIPDISLEIMLLHRIFIRVSVKVADCLGVVQIDVLKYMIYATIVLTVSYIFNKYIIPQIKNTFNSIVNQAIPTIQ